MTCGQFNALGATNTAEQAQATDAQIEVYKGVIAAHVERIAFWGFSKRAKALQYARENDQLTMLMRESLAITRAFCALKPEALMKDMAIEQFDYLLDAIAAGLNQ